MASMAEQVVAGFNKLLADQQSDGHDARMTLVQFDSHDPLEIVANAVPIAEVVPLTHDTFAPRGARPCSTPRGASSARPPAGLPTSPRPAAWPSRCCS